MTCLGQKEREIYKTFNFDNPGDEMRLVSVLEKFSEYWNQRMNTTILCHKFSTYRQHEGQNFYDFATELKNLISECDSENLHDSLLKDMVVCSTNDNSETVSSPASTLPEAISAGQVLWKFPQSW